MKLKNTLPVIWLLPRNLPPKYVLGTDVHVTKQDGDIIFGTLSSLSCS